MKNKIRNVILVSATLATALPACGDFGSDDGTAAAGTGGTPTVTGGTGGAPPVTGGVGGTPPVAGGMGGTQTATGGMGGTTAAGGTPGSVGSGLPGDVLAAGSVDCISAHSTVRVIVSGYAGPLYQLCNGRATPGPASCQGTTQDIAAVDGYADAAAHDAFCGASSCTITKIYDQSGQGNDLEPAPSGGAKPSPDDPAEASALPVTIDGHPAYGVLIQPGMGYRTGCTGCTIKEGIGAAKGDEPQTMYMITADSGEEEMASGCCFNYGNAETTSNDDGNGTMEAVYFGGGVVWGTGFGGGLGPWVMADLENGLYAGWENGQDLNISTNQPLHHDFVTAIVIGDTADKNDGKGRFALYGGDATAGELQTMYDGIRPEKTGYVPMQKQGSIILGIGGDNSAFSGGRFYEGIMCNGVATKETVDALQASIVSAGYGR